MANEELKAQNLNTALETTYRLFLEYGIDKVTKEMIARSSGLSVKTIGRYFSNRTECVIRVMEWVMQSGRLYVGELFPERVFKDGKHTGAQLLRQYMEEMKRLFFEEHRVFALSAEFRIYVHRNCEDYEQGYTMLWNWMGNRRLRQRIYKLGVEDGSFPKNLDLLIEEEYFCESFFGFLSSLSMSYEYHSREEIERQLDQRIENTMFLYTGGGILPPQGR
jgi:AcrR family transcriptional regulator